MKLPAYGISGNLRTWIADFLHMRLRVVKLNNIYSHIVSVTSGVPQGSVLGPTLFLLFINDVSNIFKELDVKLKLFADDIKLYSSYDVRGSQSDLITAVNRLYEWSCNWQLQIATEKCFVCTIANRSQNLTRRVYGINNHEFANVNSIRDLGVTIDSHLKFDQHIDLIVHKAMSRAYLILKAFNSRDRSLMVKAYCTYVRPMLEYCSPVWSPHTICQINRIEKVQRFFTKRIAGLWSVSYDKRLTILKLHSLEYRRMINDLVLCYKILNGKVDTDLSNVFKLNSNSCTRGHAFKLYKLQCNLDSTKYYFTNRIVNLWNNLPENVVSASTVSMFKNRLALIDLVL